MKNFQRDIAMTKYCA